MLFSRYGKSYTHVHRLPWSRAAQRWTSASRGSTLAQTMAPLLGPAGLSDARGGSQKHSRYTGSVIASPTENTANLFGLAPSNPPARLDGGQSERGATVSGAKLTDGSSHSCPELRVRPGGLGFKGEEGRQR